MIEILTSQINFLLVQSHQAEINIVKCPIQGRNSVMIMQVEPRLCNQGCSKNNVFPLSAMLPTKTKHGSVKD